MLRTYVRANAATAAAVVETSALLSSPPYQGGELKRTAASRNADRPPSWGGGSKLPKVTHSDKTMTHKTHRTEIHIETHEIKVVRFRKRWVLASCGLCGEIVTALTPGQTAEVLQITEDEVFRLLEAERVHLVNSQRSLALICGNSFGDANEIVTQKALSTSSK
jgi:hypothetical protein